jgi:hypothetical protein
MVDGGQLLPHLHFYTFTAPTVHVTQSYHCFSGLRVDLPHCSRQAQTGIPPGMAIRST